MSQEPPLPPTAPGAPEQPASGAHPPAPSAPTGGAPPPPPGGGYGAAMPPAAGGHAGGPPQGGMTHGAPAGGQLSQQDERMWSMLTHLGGIVLGFIAPLIVMLTQGEKSPVVRRHSVEALNFQITVFIAYVVSGLLMLLLIGFLLIFVVWIGSLIFMIMAGIKANNGEDYRYPINLRLVK